MDATRNARIRAQVTPPMLMKSGLRESRKSEKACRRITT